MIRKGLASLTLVAFGVAFLAAPAQAQLDFTDAMEIPSWAEEAIEELMDQGVISGNDDGSFAPNRQLNRAEVSKIIVLSSGVELDDTGGPHFPDVDPGAWYYDYIETMYNQGWINGYPDGYFRPAVGINRAEIAKMVVNAFEIDQDLFGAPHFDDVGESDWFYGYVETAYNNGLMRGYGDGSFGPANAVTRAETTKIVYDSQLVVSEPEGPAEGTLEVVLSDDTPRGTNVPYNATSVPYTTVELTASDDSDIEVSSLTFTRLGLGDNDDFDNVWLEIDGFKIGNDKSINNDDVVELRFNPPIVVPAGQTLVADVVTSAKYTSSDKNIGHHNRLAVVSADDLVSTAANIVGDFPIEGEEMEVADYEVSSVQFSILGSDTTVDVGDNFIEVGKFRLLNQSTSNKDIELRAITFKNTGTAEIQDNLENVAVYVSGEQVSAETIVDGDYLTFRLDNGVTGGYILEDGDSKIFSIRADVVSAEASDTLTLKIDNFEDIVGVEIGTSFGIKALYGSGSSDSSCTSGTSNAEDACATLKTYTIDSGDLNISRDPASLGNQTYAPGSNDVVFLTARVVVDQPLIVDGLRVDVATGTDLTDADTLAELNLNFDNFRFYLNDRLIDAENDFTDGGTMLTSYLNFNTTFEIAGTSIIKIVGNIADAASAGDTVKLEIIGNTSTVDAFASPEYISTGDSVSDSEVLGSAQGSFVEVQASTLTITKTDGLSDGDKIVAGVDDVEFLKFVLDNNDSGDVNITSATIAADTAVNTNNAGVGVSGSTRTYTNFTMAMFVDGTQQGSAKNLSSTGGATFNDLSVIIPSAGQKEFTVVVDTIEASATAISTTPLAGQNETALGSTADVDVASTTGMTVGDLIIWDNSGTDIVRAITAVTDSDSLALDSDLGANIADGSSVSIRHQLKLTVTGIDADNVENGQTVTVNEGGAALSTSNVLAGVNFELVSSGSLTTSIGSTVYSDILVANQSNVEVMKIRFNGADDEVQIKDIYLENDVDGNGTADNTSAGDRLSFKLYNEAGQLVQEKQMTSGSIQFELANQDRIRVPKDDSTYVTVKVDVRDITKANQTGQRLLLALDADNTTHRGLEAVTAATGSDISVPSASPYWGDAVGQNFVAYRTEMAFKHATNQPSFSDPSSASQELYRFTVTADSGRQAELGRVTLDAALSGMQFSPTGITGSGVLVNAGNTAIGSTALTVDTVDATTVLGVGDLIAIGSDTITTVTAVGSATSVTVTALTTAIADNEEYTVLVDASNVANVPLIKQVKSDGTIDDSAVVLDRMVLSAGSETAVRILGDFTGQQLAAGESRTYALFLPATAQSGSEADDDAVSISFVRDTSYAAAAARDTDGDNTYDNGSDQTGNMIWSDESSTAHSDTTSDWLNGYLLDVDTTAKVNAD